MTHEQFLVRKRERGRARYETEKDYTVQARIFHEEMEQVRLAAKRDGVTLRDKLAEYVTWGLENDGFQ